VAGYSTLTSLNGAAVVSNEAECDDTMVFVSNPAETTPGDSIFVSSSVESRSPLKSGRFSEKILSQKWITQGTDSCVDTKLTEWSCTSSKAGAKAISGKVQCQYGCANGHCILPTCFDPDIATPYTIAATTTGIMLTEPQFLGVPPQTQDAQSYADYCSSDLILTEYSCVQLGGGSHVKALQKSCKNLGKNFKCREGRCVSPELR
ncbi:MAG: hypothetical protein Q7K45_00285, partial [Nanoarchaeota archaeon]|nr:hypothetical protein [Nanoarchaeota archaeon]